MAHPPIDLRSDTVTRPTDPMRAAMAASFDLVAAAALLDS